VNNTDNSQTLRVSYAPLRFYTLHDSISITYSYL